MDETDSTKTRVVTLGEHLHKLIAVAEAAKEYRAAVRRRNTTQRQYIALCQALDELEKE